MRLAEVTTIRIANEVIRLRPTLRAATRLERRFGFERLIRDVLDGNMTTIAIVLEECAEAPSDIPRMIADMATSAGLCTGLEVLTEPVLAHVFALAGADADDVTGDPDTPDGEPVPYDEYFQRLFAIGTGWLGWSPETTWNATPAEIIAAYRGRTEMLRALFGSSDKPGDDDGTITMSQFIAEFGAGAFSTVRR